MTTAATTTAATTTAATTTAAMTATTTAAATTAVTTTAATTAATIVTARWKSTEQVARAALPGTLKTSLCCNVYLPCTSMSGRWLAESRNALVSIPRTGTSVGGLAGGAAGLYTSTVVRGRGGGGGKGSLPFSRRPPQRSTHANTGRQGHWPQRQQWTREGRAACAHATARNTSRPGKPDHPR